MAFKIYSDGTTKGTYLKDEETGQFVGCISHVKYEIDAEKVISSCQITLMNVDIELDMPANIKKLNSDEQEVRHLNVTTKKQGKKFVITSNDLNIKGAESLHPIQKIEFEADPYSRSLNVTIAKPTK
jgi:hypothetical protein